MEKGDRAGLAADGVLRVLIGHGGGGKTPQDEARSLAAASYNNLGNAYLQRSSWTKPWSATRKAVEITPDYANARSNKLRDYTHIPHVPRDQLLHEHREWWEKHTANIKPLDAPECAGSGRKLKHRMGVGGFPGALGDAFPAALVPELRPEPV